MKRNFTKTSEVVNYGVFYKKKKIEHYKLFLILGWKLNNTNDQLAPENICLRFLLQFFKFNFDASFSIVAWVFTHINFPIIILIQDLHCLICGCLWKAVNKMKGVKLQLQWTAETAFSNQHFLFTPVKL